MNLEPKKDPVNNNDNAVIKGKVPVNNSDSAAIDRN